LRVDERTINAEYESEDTASFSKGKAWVSLTLADSQREAFLREQQCLQVLRVSNDDVMKETEAVLFAILRVAGKEVV
jgi:very-short-patch-repair endonuclease